MRFSVNDEPISGRVSPLCILLALLPEPLEPPDL